MKIDKIEKVIKNNHIIQALYVFFGSLFFKTTGLFVKQDKNMILFSSFGGKSFNDSPKILFEEIKKKYGANFKYIWAFIDPKKHNIEGAKCIQINSLKYFMTALKSKYWITNVNIERGLHFQKKGCIYLNTWHGVCLDFIGNDRPGRKDYDFRRLSYICVSGDFDKKIYKSAFKCNDKQFLECGMPRNDYLVKNKFDIEGLKKEFNIPLDKKVILYAPTWRENYKNNSNENFVPPVNMDLWKKNFAKDYILLFRAHSITKNVLNVEFDDFCIDVSQYPDTNKLLSIVDILITDYSSIALDFSILERPIFNFGYDYDEYKKNHGFYVKYEDEMPNGIIYTQEELIEKINNIDFHEQQKKTVALNKKYMNYTLGSSIHLCIKKLFN